MGGTIVMAITEKKCICGCGKKFYGTIRRVYFNPACEARTRRARYKAKAELIEAILLNEQLDQIEHLEGKS